MHAQFTGSLRDFEGKWSRYFGHIRPLISFKRSNMVVFSIAVDGNHFVKTVLFDFLTGCAEILSVEGEDE
jgi:hypothetical protein